MYLDYCRPSKVRDTGPGCAVVQVHEEIVIVDVDRQLKSLGHLVVAQQVVEELSGDIPDLFGVLVQNLVIKTFIQQSVNF